MSVVIKTAPTQLMKSIKCAYTGKEAQVKLLLIGGVPLYFSDAAYSPSRPDTMENHLANLMMRDGVSGRVDQPECFVCAYTGVAMRPIKRPGGLVIFSGGFDPCIPRRKSDFVSSMFLRGGVPMDGAPEVTEDVTASFADPDKVPEDVGLNNVSITQDLARAEAERIVHTPKTVAVVQGRKPSKKSVKGK